MRTIRIVNAVWFVALPAYIGLFTDGPIVPRIYLVAVAVIAAGFLWGTRHETKTPWD